MKAAEITTKAAEMTAREGSQAEAYIAALCYAREASLAHDKEEAALFSAVASALEPSPTYYKHFTPVDGKGSCLVVGITPKGTPGFTSLTV